jgi:Sec-independent protein translocase protein TatA
MATFIITCPCCNGRLKSSGLGLGEAITSLKGEAAKREERFREQMKAEQNKGKVLDAKLQQALKKAKDDPSKPINPMDLD